ncbi:hypothetical protein MOQ_002661 [Trypanosoma cruzi marinkellei]|uniref:Uncharacterized protein n=1 Tax=Trypanosoma cruzi marinkellei TaxID=85056 RepID=K2NX38_TRYCR|nr:hypothetical protein MOQ_002661 [Trypanosoma cruzi marinkellei]
MSTPAALLSSPASLRSRCEEILCDLVETQQGLGREWKNVQPCVLRASQLLLQQAQQQDERLEKLEDKMNQVLSALEVIANDCRLKEQRYHMDRETTETALQELQHSSQQLHDALEMERRANHQFHEGILYPGLADLQQQIDRISSGVHSSVPPSQPPPPPPPLPAAVVEGKIDIDPKSGVEDSALKEMVREVRLLRNQWQEFLQQSSSAMPVSRQHVEKGPRMDVTTRAKNGGALLSMMYSGVDCSVARWHWRGGHVPSPLLSPDNPIPWSTLHVRKTTTGEWLSVGANPDGTTVHSELGKGAGLPFLWRPQRPSVIELIKGGIYRVTVCLLSSCNRHTSGNTPGSGRHVVTSALPSVSLRVNHKTVFSFFSGGSTRYTVQPAAETSRRTAKSCQACASPRRLCVCGESVICTTSNFVDFLRLPAGLCVSVHCHDMPDTSATHEALLEVELVAG